MRINLQANFNADVRRQCAMSMIELIGALTVMAVLAGMLVPSAIRIIDRIVAEREVTTLANLGDAFRSMILRTRTISNPAEWPARIAAESGLDTAQVTHNTRRVQRVFLYDKGGWLSSNLPFIQTNAAGLSTPPSRARIMLVSSLGKALPAGLNNNDLSETEFIKLWDAAENTVPPSGPWVGWAGRPDDVKVQRVNLAPLFVKSVLSSYLTTNQGRYKIDGRGPFVATTGAGMAGYFLRGTVFELLSAPPLTLQHTEVLDHDISYVYENDLWRSSIIGSVATAIGDASGIVEAFLKAPENMNALHTDGHGIQQQIIVSNFIAYMSNYNVWEDAGFPTGKGTMQDNMKQLQTNMMHAVQGIFMGTNYPESLMPCP